jgi:valyl-tRNA synthetase
VDLDLEISKCDKRLEIARQSLEKITRIERQADYEDTVPSNVRIANEDKVRDILDSYVS